MKDGRLALLYLVIVAAITFAYLDGESIAAVKHALTSITTTTQADDDE